MIDHCQCCQFERQIRFREVNVPRAHRKPPGWNARAGQAVAPQARRQGRQLVAGVANLLTRQRSILRPILFFFGLLAAKLRPPGDRAEPGQRHYEQWTASAHHCDSPVNFLGRRKRNRRTRSAALKGCAQALDHQLTYPQFAPFRMAVKPEPEAMSSLAVARP